MTSHVRSTLGAIICGLILTSCASVDINAIPLPGKNYQDGYEIVAEFANVLNLPDRANVVMNGTRVGVVTKVSIAGDHVDVTARIANDVQVPSNVKAVLQQATVLGDIYLAMDHDQDNDSGAPPLGPGGRIPLTQTTSPPQLEDTIAHLANFIGSGSIQRVQNTIIQINSVTPPKGEVRRVVSQITTDLRGLSGNIDNVDLLLHGIADTSTVLASRTAALRSFFTPSGIAGFKRNADSLKGVSTILPSLGTIYNNGYWLLPALKSLTDALGAVQGSKQAVEAEYPGYRDFIDNYFLRQDKYPAINITSIIGPDGRELGTNVQQVLRMLGAVP
jgi:phospholipid/cholesterol/gamma-HCH transport system substrate-binding protein